MSIASAAEVSIHERDCIGKFVCDSCALFPLPGSRNPLQELDADGKKGEERARAFDALLSAFCRDSQENSLCMLSA